MVRDAGAHRFRREYSTAVSERYIFGSAGGLFYPLLLRKTEYKRRMDDAEEDFIPWICIFRFSGGRKTVFESAASYRTYKTPENR